MFYTQNKSQNRLRDYSLLVNPEVGNLLQIANIVYDPKQRDHIDLLVATLKSNDTIGKLLKIFEQCAEQDDLSNMRTLRGIFNTMLLWADTNMIQELILEKHIVGVLGVLEFMSKRNLSYREQFKNMSRMELGSLLKEDLAQKFRDAEHLEFFKSQVASQYQQKTQLNQALGRLIYWKHLDIVNWIQQDTLLTQRLFRLLDDKKDTSIIDRQITLDIMHKVFVFAEKDMQEFACVSFIRTLVDKGLLELIQRLLYDNDINIQKTAAKLLHIIVRSDVWMIQNNILAQAGKDKQASNLLQVTLDQLANVDDYVQKQQLFDIIKILLGQTDSSPNSLSSSGFISQSIFDDSPVPGNMLKLFYERYAFSLIQTTHSINIKPIDMTNPVEPLEISHHQFIYYSCLCDFLRLIMVQYGSRTKRILLDHPCFENMAQLLRHQDLSLKLKVLRFFRAAIGLRDTDINILLVNQNVFTYIVRLLLDTNAQQHQTIHSEIEELLGFIRNMNMIILLDHIIPEFGSIIESTVSTPVYNSLITRHEKNITDGVSLTNI
ncbi:hypothetical protein BC941DRAFT_423458 [Chlamydoabsidia padenii]|nr:hypothetical protein BC941DRAFT_423458 [Chlamydoabsidia padenii]